MVSLLLDRCHFVGILHIIGWIFPVCTGSGQFKLVTQGIHTSTHCPVTLSLCLKEQQDNPSWTGDCSYGNMTSQPVLPCSYSNWTDCGDNVTMLIPFDFSWTKTFTLVLEMMCDNETFIDRSLYSGSLLPGQPGLVVSHNSDLIRLSYVISVNCSANYYSSSCSKLCRPRHDDFGHYTCDRQGEKVCLNGWKGENCHIAICKDGCHEVHGSCDRPGECRCAFGWQGPLCDECRPYPGCKHGSCQGSPWQCICDHHWGGILCDKDLNPCGRDSYPCENGGVCENIQPGEYRCVCKPMYTGKHCQIGIAGCLSDGCYNGGTCVVMDTRGYCECTPGWTGPTCQTELNECSSSPCVHGLCQDQLDSFLCNCDSGWQGTLCDQDLDECLYSPCLNNALGCHNYVGGYSCECVEGWSGNNCQINLNECTGDSCQNGGTCVDTIGGFLCSCLNGYQGNTCESDIDECLVDPCHYGGTCSNTFGGFSCTCTEGYTEKQCQTEVDPCLSGPCHSTATCIRLAEGYKCLCPQHHTGSQCMQIVDVVPCTINGCEEDMSCFSDGHVFSNGDTWSQDCNTCTCNHGDILCSQIVCGQRNCILHSNQLEEHYYCHDNQSCDIDSTQSCLTPPCLLWGVCNPGKQQEVTSHVAIELKLNVNTTAIPKGVYLEVLCSAIRQLPSLKSISHHMTVQVTCTIPRDKAKGNVNVNIGTKLLIDVKLLQGSSNYIIQDMLSNNDTLLRTVTSVHINKSITVMVTSKTVWPMLVSCAVLITAGLLSILLLIFCYSHRQTQLKQSTSQHQALLGQRNNQQPQSTTVSRHGNPIFNPVLEHKYLQIKLNEAKSGENLNSNSEKDVEYNGSNDYCEMGGGYYENLMDEQGTQYPNDETGHKGVSCGKYGNKDFININVHKERSNSKNGRSNKYRKFPFKETCSHGNNHSDGSVNDGIIGNNGRDNSNYGNNYSNVQDGSYDNSNSNRGRNKQNRNSPRLSDNDQHGENGSHYYENQKQCFSGPSSSYNFQGQNDFDVNYQSVQSSDNCDVHSDRGSRSSSSSPSSREIRIVLETNQKYHLNISDLKQT